MKDKFTFQREFLEIANSLEDNNLRMQYLEAVIQYGLDWTEPDNQMLRWLLVTAKIKINKQDELAKSRSVNMKGNKNSIKGWSNAEKHTKTESNTENREQHKKQKEEINEQNCEIIAKEKTDGIYNISNIYNTSINNTLYNIIKYYTTNKSIYPQIKYLIDKKWFDAYVEEQYKEWVILKKKIWLENLKTILKFCLTDEFRKNQILSIRKLNEKNKDKVPYYLVISEKLLLNKDAQTNNVCSIPTV